jgi:hypothetical protein
VLVLKKHIAADYGAKTPAGKIEQEGFFCAVHSY